MDASAGIIRDVLFPYHETSRSWSLDPARDWVPALQYIATQWSSHDIVIRRWWANLETGRQVTGESIDELLAATLDVRPLVELIGSNLDLTRYDEALAGVEPKVLEDEALEARLYLLLPGDKGMRPSVPTITLDLRTHSRVVTEGLSAVLGATVEEWALANGPIDATDTSPEQEEAHGAVLPVPSTPSGSMPLIARTILSALLGAVAGASALSTIAYGFDEGPSPILLSLAAALGVAVIVYRFGLNK